MKINGSLYECNVKVLKTRIMMIPRIGILCLSRNNEQRSFYLYIICFVFSYMAVHIIMNKNEEIKVWKIPYSHRLRKEKWKYRICKKVRKFLFRNLGEESEWWEMKSMTKRGLSYVKSSLFLFIKAKKHIVLGRNIYCVQRKKN